MRTAVVILNWNTREHLMRWLPGLVSSVDGREDKVIVADNASTDGSAEYVSQNFPELQLMRFESNLGFTGGYNKALSQIGDAKYFALVNSDIDAPIGWLKPLLDWMDEHPGCAACGPKIHALKPLSDGSYERTYWFEYAGAAGGYIDHYGYPFCRGRVLSRTEKDLGQYDTPASVEWVSGACMVIRASAWKDLGGFDHRFFAHMEEIDFCLRARRAGWSIDVVPQSTVWHLGGGTLPQASPFKLKLNYRNSLLMLRKFMPKWRLTIRRAIDFCASIAYLITGKKEYFKAVMQAHKEARVLEKGEPWPMSPFKPGLMDGIRIIPLAILKKDKAFKYLKDYEDSHCRCR